MKIITEAHITISELSEIRDSIDEALAEVTVPLGSDFDSYEFLPEDKMFVIYYTPSEPARHHLASLKIDVNLG